MCINVIENDFMWFNIIYLFKWEKDCENIWSVDVFFFFIIGEIRIRLY